ERQNKILNRFPEVTDELFANHLALLQLSDNLSLYISLNHPGVAKEYEHRFFKNGIPVGQELNIKSNLVHAIWQDKNTVRLENLPEVPAFTVTLNEKRLAKADIQKFGLAKSYRVADCIKKQIAFKTIP